MQPDFAMNQFAQKYGQISPGYVVNTAFIAMNQFAQKYGQISRGYVGNSASYILKWCILSHAKSK